MRSLLIGYGNPSRRDDGAALHVVNAWRARQGQPGLTPETDGWEDLGSAQDSLFLQQLTPELAALLAQYDRVAFVDTALPETGEPVRVHRLTPSYRLSVVSHHMTPETLLALAGQLYGRQPEGYLVSIHGHDFGFGDRLSPETEAAVPEAVERVASLMAV